MTSFHVPISIFKKTAVLPEDANQNKGDNTNDQRQRNSAKEHQQLTLSLTTNGISPIPDMPAPITPLRYPNNGAKRIAKRQAYNRRYKSDTARTTNRITTELKNIMRAEKEEKRLQSKRQVNRHRKSNADMRAEHDSGEWVHLTGHPHDDNNVIHQLQQQLDRMRAHAIDSDVRNTTNVHGGARGGHLKKAKWCAPDDAPAQCTGLETNTKQRFSTKIEALRSTIA